MTAFEPGSADYERRTRESFARQAAMALIGAEITRVEPGRVEIVLPFSAQITQQHGFIHAGITSAIADTAGGFAAFTLFPPEVSVLTAEYKINLLSPAVGPRLVAVGEVLKPGRTLTTCEVAVYNEDADGRRKLCAKLLQTLARVGPRSDIEQAG